MGEFSWITQNTDKQIGSMRENTIDVAMVWFDKHGKMHINTERNYQGHGEFGGKDYYEALAEMNGYSEVDIEAYKMRKALSRALHNLEYDWLQNGQRDSDKLMTYLDKANDDFYDAHCSKYDKDNPNLQIMREMGIDVEEKEIPAKHTWSSKYFSRHSTIPVAKFDWNSFIKDFDVAKWVDRDTLRTKGQIITSTIVEKEEHACEKKLHTVDSVYQFWNAKKDGNLSSAPILYPQLLEYDSSDGSIFMYHKLDFTEKPEQDPNQGWYQEEECYDEEW